MARLGATALMAATLLAGCASGGMTTGPILPTARIERELQRGTSTKMDVRRVLGSPKGSGSALLPTDPRPRDVWVYLETQTGAAERVGERHAHVASHVQFLVVFFLEGVLDGFMWYEGTGTAKVSP